MGWGGEGRISGQYTPMDAILESFDVEVEEQPEWKGSGSPIAHELAEMHFVHAIDGLEFNDDQITHDEVQRLFADGTVLVRQANGNLASEGNTPWRAFVADRLLVEALEQARPKRCVGVHRGGDHLLGEPIPLWRHVIDDAGCR